MTLDTSPARREEYELSSTSSSEQFFHSFPPSQKWHQKFFTRLSTWFPVHSARYKAIPGNGDMDDVIGTTTHPLHNATRYRRSSWMRRAIWVFGLSLSTILTFIILGTLIWYPSYSHPPNRYRVIHERATQSQEPGRANIHGEKIFIAATLLDHKGHLAAGPWSRSVLKLIDLLGPDNVFLSVYEDDPDDKAKSALEAFSAKVTCNSSIVTEHVERGNLPHVKLPNGSERLKRIVLLAHARNRALAPLDDRNSSAYTTRFDKLLYINDIMFNPIDAANLLFSTNVDDSERAQYRAACAADFVNPVKYYDTFATRDLEGYSMGIPIFPWFSDAGKGESRGDVLDQKDAVRVRSCWGGMVAFDARWFQSDELDHPITNADEAIVVNDTATSMASPATGASTPSTTTQALTDPTPSIDYHPEVDANLNWHLTNPFGSDITSHSKRLTSPARKPLRFRASTDTFWDASECCLIHADLASLQSNASSLEPDSEASTEIYLNPYIRVAYTPLTLSLLPLGRRLEKSFAAFQGFMNRVLNLPKTNPRREATAGEEVIDRIWVDAGLSLGTGDVGDGQAGYRDVRRIALPGGFCGQRLLLVMGEGDRKRQWWGEDVPSDDGI